MKQINRTEAIKHMKVVLKTCDVQDEEAVEMAIKALEQPKTYTKAEYVMALHKEYGCTLTRAEEAHDKALEYLRNKAIMKG